jgi:hypothetical protein
MPVNMSDTWSKAAAEPPMPTLSPTVGWHALSVAEVGESHLSVSPPVPCQDACTALAGIRPLLLVADGLGSRPLSHVGSDAVVRLVPCFLTGIEDLSAALLDREQSGEEGETCQRYARRIVCFADAVLKDVGGRMGHAEKAFQCTLLLAVAGAQSVFWLKIGDGSIVFEGKDGVLSAVGETGGTGDPSVTEVVRTAMRRETLACGLVATAGIAGIAAFSDGVGERLISADGTEVAGFLRKLLAALREGAVSRIQVLDFLRDRRVWEMTSRDDRSLALLAQRG